ncbi:MAG TPA: hypothetical protein VNV17_26135 [Solirubrobacteraceae bacterium]|nr:hypothetical protein [Solirubrobacteraceae bacterium]
MTHCARARPALATAALAVAAALAGCAQSSDTTSAGRAGSVPTTTAPSTTSTTTSATTTTSSTTPGAGSGSLTVSPTTASPHSTIHFAFTAPAGVAAPGPDDVSAGLSVIGPQKPGCVGLHREPLTSLPPGQHTSVSLGPAQLGGDWCPGTYSARVEVLARPKCGPGMMCPQFIRVVAMLGPATFKISG